MAISFELQDAAGTAQFFIRGQLMVFEATKDLIRSVFEKYKMSKTLKGNFLNFWGRRTFLVYESDGTKGKFDH